MLQWLEQPTENEIEHKHKQQIELAKSIIDWTEERIQTLKDEVRVKNQEILLLKLKIKNYHDQSKKNQGLQN